MRPARAGQDGRLHDQDLLGHGARIHADLVPGVPRRRLVRSAHVRARPERQCTDDLRRQRAQRHLHASASPPTCYQKYRFDLKYIDYFGQYKDNGVCRHHAERLHHAAEGSRIRQPDVQDDHLEAGDQHEVQIRLSSGAARSGLRLGGLGRRHRRGSQAARHHADRGRRRTCRQQGRHDSRVQGRADDAAGGLQGRRRHSSEPVRRRETAADRSTPRTWRSMPTS